MTQVQLRPLPLHSPIDRDRLVRRARLLAWAGLAWHLAEAAVGVAAGVAAGSIALIAFGADSVIEGAAALIVIWRFRSSRSLSEAAELRAQRLIAITFFALAAYVTVEAGRTFATAAHPDTSAVGIALAAITLAVMPPLARAKARVGEKLGSSATRSEGRQNMVCAYLSAALLIGLVLNAAAGLWWADPITALLIAGVALKEGRDAWRGDGCDCC